MVSRVLGLAREVLVAAFFGATRTLDAFNVAYTLANDLGVAVAPDCDHLPGHRVEHLACEFSVIN